MDIPQEHKFYHFMRFGGKCGSTHAPESCRESAGRTDAERDTDGVPADGERTKNPPPQYLCNEHYNQHYDGSDINPVRYPQHDQLGTVGGERL